MLLGYTRFKKWVFVLYDKSDIETMKTFVKTHNVEKYAYIKHSRSLDNRPHYHFYVELKSCADEIQLEDIAEVPSYHAYPLKASADFVITYFIKGFTVDDLQSGIFSTNIRKYSCYNAV